MQAATIKTPGLRSAYLEAIDAMAQGRGAKALERKLEVAYQERMRYYANRIAQTELHRAWVDKQASEIMGDDTVEVVQFKMSGTHPRTDICDLYAHQDAYGLGPGLYPKEYAPKPPLHPHCRCGLISKRLISAKGAKENPAAGRQYLRSVMRDDGVGEAARIMGSRAKLQQALKPDVRVEDVFNTYRAPPYLLGRVGDLGQRDWPVSRPDFSAGKGKMPSMNYEIDQNARLGLTKQDGDGRAYVVGNGKKTGFEYLYAYDADSGKVLARHTDGRNDGVGMPDALRDVVRDRSRNVVIHHNHPNSMPPSAGDINAIGHFPGISSAVISGHDGSYYRVDPIQRGKIVKAIQATTGIARRLARSQEFAALPDDAYEWIVTASRVDAFAKAGLVKVSSNVKRTGAYSGLIESMSGLMYSEIVKVMPR